MTFFLEQLVNALLLGGIYALIAVGYTMVYGIIKLINFAHGEIYMFGAFFGILSIAGLGVPFWVALLFAIIGCATLGFLVDFLAYRSVRGAPRLAALITAVGVSLFLQNLAMLMWGTTPRPFPALSPHYHVSFTAEQEPTKQKLIIDLQALKDNNYDSLPYLDSYQQAKAAVANATKTGGAELNRSENYLRIVTEEIPRIDHVYAAGDGLNVIFANGENSSRISALFEAAWSHYLKDAPQKPVVTGKDHWFNRGFIGSRAQAEGLFLPNKVVFIWVITVVLLVLIDYVVQKTRLGKAMRACSQDPGAAALMGINVRQIISYTFMLGSAMAAVAGVCYGLYLGSQIGFRMGVYPGVIAFSAAVLGGIGNLRGAFVGGIIMGAVEVFTRVVVCPWLAISGDYSIAFVFGILILVILVRPSGIFPSAAVNRA